MKQMAAARIFTRRKRFTRKEARASGTPKRLWKKDVVDNVYTRALATLKSKYDAKTAAAAKPGAKQRGGKQAKSTEQLQLEGAQLSISKWAKASRKKKSDALQDSAGEKAEGAGKKAKAAGKKTSVVAVSADAAMAASADVDSGSADIEDTVNATTTAADCAEAPVGGHAEAPVGGAKAPAAPRLTTLLQ